VFEDLHWADDAMLSFLEHLADRAAGEPGRQVERELLGDLGGGGPGVPEQVGDVVRVGRREAAVADVGKQRGACA